MVLNVTISSKWLYHTKCGCFVLLLRIRMHYPVLQHCLVKSKIRYRNTLPKYVTKYNVFCVTEFGFFFFYNCEAGFSSQANFYLLLGAIPSE